MRCTSCEKNGALVTKAIAIRTTAVDFFRDALSTWPNDPSNKVRCHTVGHGIFIDTVQVYPQKKIQRSLEDS